MQRSHCLQAAEYFVEARWFEKAANLYLELGRFAEAAECFEAKDCTDGPARF